MMVNYLQVISNWMEQPQYLLIFLIGIYFVAGTFDFLIGSFNAAYNKEVQFSSRKAQLGIIRKLVTLVVMILMIPMALILPLSIGISALVILYIGIAGSEIYSILGHVGIVKDGDKQNNIVGKLFTNLLDSVYKSKDVDK